MRIRAAVFRVMSQGVVKLRKDAPLDGSELSLAMRPLMKGRKIQGIMEGNSNPDVFIPRLIDFFMQGRFPFDRLTRFYPFDEIAKAFHDSEAGNAVKPILRMT